MTVAGRPATSMRITLPSWGVWYLDASIAGEHELAGPAACVFSDLALSGTFLPGGTFSGRTLVRVVGGRGGWGKDVAAAPYHDDGGVFASVVLQAAAQAAGEVIDAATLPTKRLGAHFTRAVGPASRVLEQLSPSAWYVGEDGITRIGARPGGVLPAGVAVSRVDRVRGVVELASEKIATILPGITAEGLRITDVQHEATAETGLRTTLCGSLVGGPTRRLALWRRLLDALDPSRPFRGVVEYRVVQRSGKRLDLQPVRVAAGMPTLRRVRVWPGVPGCDADSLLGSRVLVGWIDSDPSRPYVAAFEDAEGEGFVADMLRIAEGTAFAARVGDSVSVTLVGLPVMGGGGGSVSGSATGTITAGSSKVKIG